MRAVDVLTLAEPVMAGAAVVSAVVALVALQHSRRSARAARNSAATARMSAELSYVGQVSERSIPVDLRLTRVEFRWSTSTMLFDHEGRATDPGIEADAVSIEHAEEIGLAAEMVIEGTLENRTSIDQLVTVYGGRGSRRPLQNEGVFLVGDQDTHRAVLGPEDRIDFLWVDRWPLRDWRELSQALNRRDLEGDEVSLPAPEHTLRERVRRVMSPEFGHRHHLDRRAEIRRRFGFRIVAEPRMESRLALIWQVEPARSAIRPSMGDEVAAPIAWRLSRGTAGAVDDDLVRYRCAFDTTLAQISPTGLLQLPGRF